MNIPFSFDQTGFPLLHLFDLGCYVHLLPVSKVQFAAYAGEHEYTREVYEEACRKNPLDPEAPAHTRRLENHFMTAVLPAEATHFADWMGEEGDPDAVFKLPSASEWRDVYRYLQYEVCEPLLERIRDDCPNPAARELIGLITASRHPHTLLELSLMRAGVVEWVQENARWKGLGCPDTSFFPNTFEPLRDAFEPIDPDRRLREFGFRLIRSFR